MERYFLGNNTAYGFYGNYEDELKDKQKVVLLKGGPGTGKSTILKRIAKEAEKRGFDYELWFCSGDPKSLDGVFVKDLNAAIVDATAPHATGADLPVVKDVIVDLATSLKKDVLDKYGTEIKELIKCKKHKFMRAYQHLKLAFCHLNNQIELETSGVDKAGIRLVSGDFARTLKEAETKEKSQPYKIRKVFTTAICPYGESVFYDCLKGKRIVKIIGGEVATCTFFDELSGLIDGGTLILNPLDPKRIDGVIYGDSAIVKDAGVFEDEVARRIDLSAFEKFEDVQEIVDERNGVTLQTAFAVEELNDARSFHLELEKYFVEAMDFDNNDKLCERIANEIFGA